MTDDVLIASVRAGDLARVRGRLDAGAEVDARDDHEWTALSWAAGAGALEIARLLLDRGADVFATGSDGRTPYQIALAANRVEVAHVLAAAEASRGGDAVARSSGQAASRPYCRAYQIRDLRRFTGWTEPGDADGVRGDTLADDTIVFVHRDLRVTRTIDPRDGVVFDGASADWARFCAEDLQCQPPGDFDWLPTPAAAER